MSQTQTEHISRNISIVHMFISIKLTETTKTGSDKTYKIHKKSRRFQMYTVRQKNCTILFLQ